MLKLSVRKISKYNVKFNLVIGKTSKLQMNILWINGLQAEVVFRNTQQLEYKVDQNVCYFLNFSS